MEWGLLIHSPRRSKPVWTAPVRHPTAASSKSSFLDMVSDSIARRSPWRATLEASRKTSRVVAMMGFGSRRPRGVVGKARAVTDGVKASEALQAVLSLRSLPGEFRSAEGKISPQSRHQIKVGFMPLIGNARSVSDSLDIRPEPPTGCSASHAARDHKAEPQAPIGRVLSDRP
jgi:hypothetical protein